jgi:hypothetical protein
MTAFKRIQYFFFLASLSSFSYALDLSAEKLKTIDKQAEKLRLTYVISREIISDQGVVQKTEETGTRNYMTGENWDMELQLKSGINKSNEVFFYEKNDHAVLDMDQKIASVSSEKAYFQAKNYEWLGLTNGPCLPLGRGFSKLADLQTKTVGNETILTGRAEDHSLIEAHFVGESVLPSKVIRSFSDSPTKVEWTYAGEIKAPSGAIFPKTAVSKVLGLDSKVNAEFKIIKLENPIAQPDTPGWLRKDFPLSDRRFAPALTLPYSSIEHIKSLEELKQISQSKYAELQAGLAKGEKYVRKHEQNQQTQTSKIILPILFAVLGIGAVWLSRVLKRPSQ